jgi:surfactin synthase thioesterase subunit
MHVGKNSWILNYSEQKNCSYHLFCFHHAGGTASFFYQWKNHLPADIRLHAIQLPGREQRFSEPFATSLQTIVEKISDSIETMTQPFIFFGHSLGSLLAFEVASRLTNKKKAPAILFLSSHLAPHRTTKKHELLQLSDQEFIKETAYRYGGLSNDILSYPELMELALPRLRADIGLYTDYAYQFTKPCSIPIITLGGTHDRSLDISELLAWETYTSGKFSRYLFSGDHFYLQQHTEALTQLLVREIESLPTL